MQSEGLESQIKSESANAIWSVVFGLISAAVGAAILKKFPILGDFSPIIGALLLGIIVFALSQWMTYRKAKAQWQSAGSVSGEKPAVLLATLVGDTNNVRQLEIDRAIRRLFKDNIQVLVGPQAIPTGIGVKDERERSIRDLAEDWLARTNCHVLVYGTVSGVGATHLSMFSKSKGVQEISGLSGELLDFGANFSTQIVSHISSQIAMNLFHESGNLLGDAELDSMISIINDLLETNEAVVSVHNLLSIKAAILFEKGRRSTGNQSLLDAQSTYQQARDLVSPIDHEHLWNASQVGLALCVLLIGMRTGNRSMLQSALERFERDASHYSGKRCEQCNQRAISQSAAARIEILKRFWSVEDWNLSFEYLRNNSLSFTDASTNRYWSSRELVLQLLIIGIRNLALPDDIIGLANKYCDEALSIPAGISLPVRKGFIGAASVVQDVLFRRSGDSKFGYSAVELIDEQLSYLSKIEESSTWAQFQINKCVTLAEIGHSQIGVGNLIRAVSCGGDALEILDKNSNPQEWARGNNALGVAYDYLAKKQLNAVLFRKSYELYADASLSYARMRSRSDWAMSRMNMAIVQCWLASIEYNNSNEESRRSASEKCFIESERAAKAVIKYYRRINLLPQLSMALSNMSFIYSRHGWTVEDDKLVNMAIDISREGLVIADPIVDGRNWSSLTFNLINDIFGLYVKSSDVSQSKEVGVLIHDYLRMNGSDTNNTRVVRIREIQAALIN